MPGKKRLASTLPTATRPTFGTGSTAQDATRSAASPNSSAWRSGARRPQIGSPLASASRKPSMRASLDGTTCAHGASTTPSTGASRVMRTASPAKSSLKHATIARSVSAAVPARISASVSCCVRTASRSLSCALPESSCRRRVSSRFFSRSTSSW